jgi:hypothetical protein
VYGMVEMSFVLLCEKVNVYFVKLQFCLVPSLIIDFGIYINIILCYVNS